MPLVVSEEAGVATPSSAWDFSTKINGLPKSANTLGCRETGRVRMLLGAVQKFPKRVAGTIGGLEAGMAGFFQWEPFTPKLSGVSAAWATGREIKGSDRMVGPHGRTQLFETLERATAAYPSDAELGFERGDAAFHFGAFSDVPVTQAVRTAHNDGCV